MQTNDDLFDLHLYVRRLLRAWKYIVGFVLLTVLATAAYLLTRERDYQAVALVAVTSPNYYMNFDPRFQTVTDVQPNYRAYPELAMNTEILTNLLSAWLDHPNSIQTVDDLRGVLGARNLTDPSIVELTASLPDAEQAAFVANLWAQIFITRAREVYGGTGTGQVQFFEAQLEKANQDVAAAEKALVDFDNQISVRQLENELDSLLAQQREWLNRQTSIETILRDIDAYLVKLAGQQQDQATVADQLSFLTIQLRTFFSQENNGEQPAGLGQQPYQIQLDNLQSDGQLTTAQQRRLLGTMQEVLGDQRTQLDEALTELQPRILEQQKALQEATLRRNTLEQQYELANETVETLTRKVYEVRISVDDSSGEVRLAARAIPPINPRPRNLIRNLLFAGIGSGILAVVVVTVVLWWIGDRATGSR